MHSDNQQWENVEGIQPWQLKRSKKLPWKLKMMSTKWKANERTNEDIGDIEISDQFPQQPLNYDMQRHLKLISEDINNQRVSRGRLEYAPDWIMDDALRKEYEDNWKPHTTTVPESKVGISENFVHCPVGYKMKTHEDGSLSIKGRICPHVNRDKKKDKIRKDSTNAQFDVIRLLLCFSCHARVSNRRTDVKAFMKSGHFTRHLYVRPP